MPDSLFDRVDRAGATQPPEGESVFDRVDREQSDQDVTQPADAGGRGVLLPGIVAFTGAKAAPRMIGLVNRGAGLVGKIATSAGRRVAGPALAYTAIDAAGDVLGGNPGRGAQKVAGAAAVTAAGVAVPKVARAIQTATAPAGDVGRGALGRFVAGHGEPLTRAVGVIGRAAPAIGLAVETVFGEGASGHRPLDHSPETTAARQADVARQFRDSVNAKSPGAIQGTTTAEIIESIRRYRGQ